MLAKDAMRKVLTEAKTGAYINTLYVTNDQDMLVGGIVFERVDNC